MTTSRIRPVIAILVSALVVGALVSSAGASPAAHPRTPARSTKIVKGIVSHWSPTIVRISTGGQVRWKAVTGTHTVTAYGHWTFNHSLPQGTSVTRRFTRKGTFRFRCTIHSSLVNGVCTGMCGKVVVS